MSKAARRRLQAAGFADRAAGKSTAAHPGTMFSSEAHEWLLGWWKHYYAEERAAEIDSWQAAGM